MILETFSHVPGLWGTWGSSMAVLVAGGAAAWVPRARGVAVLAPVLVTLVMLSFVSDGIQMGWGMIDGTHKVGLSVGLHQASAAGVAFGVPLVLACFAIALPGALAARDLPVERPNAHILAVVAGGLAVALELAALASADPAALIVGGGALSLLLWMVHAATALDPRSAALVPVGAVAVWCAVTGATTVGVLEGMQHPDIPELLAGDPWRLRAVVFGAALAYALLVGKRWGALALPVVLGVLLAGSSINLLRAVHLETADAPPPSRW